MANQPQTNQPAPAQSPHQHRNGWRLVLFTALAFALGAAFFAAIFFVVTRFQLNDRAESEVETTDTVESTEELNRGPDVTVSVEIIDESAPLRDDQIRVAWNEARVAVAAASLGLDETVFDAWKVGEVVAGQYAGAAFLVLDRLCEGHCGNSLYRVIDSADGLVFLNDYSNVLIGNDQDLFVAMVDDYVFDLNPSTSFDMIVNHYEITLFEEELVPAKMLDDFLSDYHSYATYEHDLQGRVWSDLDAGYFIVENSDHTVTLYQAEFPFEVAAIDSLGALTVRTEPDWLLDNNIVISPDYSLAYITCPPLNYSILTDADLSSRLELLGKTFTGEELYVPTSTDDELYTTTYEQYYATEKPDYEEWLAEYPVLVWQDVFGRWFKLTNIEYLPAIEMGCAFVDSAL